MKQFITPSYTFTPGASSVGNVNLSGISSFDIKNLVAIINQTKGIVIYSTGSASLKYTSVSGTTVYLNYNTSSMSSGDTLQVIYEKSDDNLSSIDTKFTSLINKTAGALIPVNYDEVIPSYVGSTTKLDTVIYKLSSSTVAILTFGYDGSDRITSVVRS